MTITIRQLKPDDWAILKDLRLTALQSDPKVFGGSYADEKDKTDEEWRGQLESEKVATFALFDGDVPIGMTGIAYDRKDPAQKTAILWGSWLKPEYRKRGLSNLMYTARLDWAEARPDIDRVLVGHRASNLASKRANQKHGFAFMCAESRTWHDGITEDDVSYVRFIHNPWGVFPVETERLVLRPVLATDLDALHEAKTETWAQLQQSVPWAKNHAPEREADGAMCAEQEEKFREGEDCMLLGFEKDTNRLVISTGLHEPDWENRVFEIGYWVRLSAQGMGYAQEATRALTDHAFNALKASIVKTAAWEHNAASLAVIARCGFTPTHSIGGSLTPSGRTTLWFEKRAPCSISRL